MIQPPRIIPYQEVLSLVMITLDAYKAQYAKIVNPLETTFMFIPARTDTRFGIEIESTVSATPFMIRLYAENFTLLPNIKPFRIEEIINRPNAQGIQLFVSISDLPLALFPNLSETTNPVVGARNGPYAIQLEDLSGYIQQENGDDFQLEVFSGNGIF